jgi:carbonic anhydrase
LSTEDPTKIAVVALLIQLTDWESISTLALADIISHVQAIQTPGTRTTIPTLDFTRLIHTVGTLPFYAYQGSLTTPPCSEGVAFVVAAHPIPLHVSAYNALKAVMKANARFSQNELGQQNLLEVASGKLGGLPKGEGVGGPTPPGRH